jgi:hypothetical protein
MMTGEQILTFTGIAAGVIFGGGGLAALLGVFVTRKLGIKTSENEANRDLNHTWDAIVENLQSQITALHNEVVELRKGQGEVNAALSVKERLLLKAILHIGRLELLVPPNTVPPRPEGLE